MASNEFPKHEPRGFGRNDRDPLIKDVAPAAPEEPKPEKEPEKEAVVKAASAPVKAPAKPAAKPVKKSGK